MIIFVLFQTLKLGKGIKNMKKVTIILFLSIFFSVVNPLVSKAEEGIDFSVKPQITSSQIGDNDSYFNLRSVSDKKETLPIKITNHSQTEVTYIVNVNTATTNMNGIIDYSQQNVKLIETEYQLANLVEKQEQTVSIPGGAEKIVDIDLTMPKNSFEGVILGGIIVAKKQNEQNEAKNTIKNEFQYAIAVQLSNNDKKVKSELTGEKVELTQINKRNAVQMTIKNPQPKLLKQVEGTFTIKKKGQNTAIVEEKRSAMSIAPNSEFSLFTMLNDKFKSGEYTYTINLKNTEGDWTFSQDFSIKQKQASDLNKTSVDQTPKQFSWLLIVAIMGIIILALAAALSYTLWKFKKTKKTSN